MRNPFNDGIDYGFPLGVSGILPHNPRPVDERTKKQRNRIDAAIVFTLVAAALVVSLFWFSTPREVLMRAALVDAPQYETQIEALSDKYTEDWYQAYGVAEGGTKISSIAVEKYDSSEARDMNRLRSRIAKDRVDLVFAPSHVLEYLAGQGLIGSHVLAGVTEPPESITSEALLKLPVQDTDGDEKQVAFGLRLGYSDTWNGVGVTNTPQSDDGLVLGFSQNDDSEYAERTLLNRTRLFVPATEFREFVSFMDFRSQKG